MRRPVNEAVRSRLKLCGAAALLLLCAACGDGIPKDKDDDDSDEPPPPAAAALSILAGDATAEGMVDGPGTAARFRSPQGIAIDASGNLYVADRNNQAVRKITPEGVVTTVAGVAGDSRIVNGRGGDVRFAAPVALAVNGSGTIFVADNNDIRSITTAGVATTVATIPAGANVDNRALGRVYPGAIAVDGNGNLFVTNSYGTRRIAANGTVLLEGQNTLDDLRGVQDLVPRGVAVDSSNLVYLFDLERELSRWNPNGNIGSDSFFTLAGAPNERGSADGTGNVARFGQVVALTVDQQGNVYAADDDNKLVRRITQAGVVTTVAGTRGATTLQVGNLPGSLPGVRGIVADGKGNLYATAGNAVIRIRLP